MVDNVHLSAAHVSQSENLFATRETKDEGISCRFQPEVGRAKRKVARPYGDSDTHSS